MAKMTIDKDLILTVESLDENIPSCSRYNRGLAGYFLYVFKDKWVFPFKRTKIKLNILTMTFPDNTIGIIDSNPVYNSDYDILSKYIINDLYGAYIEVRSKRLIPFKINKCTAISVLHIIPSLECHIVTN